MAQPKNRLTAEALMCACCTQVFTTASRTYTYTAPESCIVNVFWLGPLIDVPLLSKSGLRALFTLKSELPDSRLAGQFLP